MQVACPPVTVVAVEAVATVGHLPVKPLPKRHRSRQVEPGDQRPKSANAPGNLTHPGRAVVEPSATIDNDHLAHQRFVRQFRITPADFRVVQREKRQPPMACPTSPAAKLGIKVFNRAGRIGTTFTMAPPIVVQTSCL